MPNNPERELPGLLRALKESSTYQEIFQEGLEKGRAAAARAFLLRRASKVLGEPDAATLRTLETITDIRQLHELTDRVIDGHAGSWADLLGAAA